MCVIALKEQSANTSRSELSNLPTNDLIWLWEKHDEIHKEVKWI